MTNLLLTIIFLGKLHFTAYRPIPAQTKPEGYEWTSIGDKTTQFGCAVSQDLLKSDKVHYGDVLFIEGQGFRIVNDCMNARWKKAIDVLVFSYQEEKKVGVSYKRVWVVREKGMICDNVLLNNKKPMSNMMKSLLVLMGIVIVVLIGIGYKKSNF